MKLRQINVVLVHIAVLAAVHRAHAGDQCISAYEQTQTLRKDGKLVAAKAQAALCSRDSCPGLLVKDCVHWLAEIDASTPSLVFDVRGPSGAELLDTHVTLDGAVLTERVGGRAMAVDPGTHVLRFQADGMSPLERRIVLREGERSRKIEVRLKARARPDDAPEVARPVPLGVWIFGGVSVVALATSAVFALDGLGKKSDLEQCKPRCAPEDVDAMSTRFTFADVGLGAGVVAGAAAVYVLLSRGATPARAQPFAAPLPSGGAAGIRASF